MRLKYNSKEQTYLLCPKQCPVPHLVGYQCDVLICNGIEKRDDVMRHI